MASVPVTIIGVMTYSDLAVGGGPMPGGPEVTHPIAPGGPPPQVWPGPGVPTHPIVIPPDAIAPGVPTHPIVIPQPPLGFWGGRPPEYVDIGFPGPQPPTGQPPGIWGGPYFPPRPTHPIVLPPVTPGGPPVVIWPNPPEGQAPIPSHPIVLPPPPPDSTLPDGGKPPPPEGGWGYHPAYGWGYFPPGGKPMPSPIPPDPNAPVVNPLK